MSFFHIVNVSWVSPEMNHPVTIRAKHAKWESEWEVHPELTKKKDEKNNEYPRPIFYLPEAAAIHYKIHISFYFMACGRNAGNIKLW